MIDTPNNQDDIDRIINERVEQTLAKSLKAEMRRRSIEDTESKNGKIFKRVVNDSDSIYKSRIDTGSADNEDWLITYADTITLVLTLFVLLFSLSQVDQKKFEKVKESINKELLKKDDNVSFQQMENKVKGIFQNSGGGGKVLVNMDADGLRIELSSSALYGSGSADIKNEVIPELKELAQLISRMRVTFPNYLVEVEGHTDNNPINTERYPSNWELSTNRATNIVKFFIEQGIPPTKLRAAGYSDSRPKLPNTDRDGNPIYENQAANRRVVIYVRRAN